MRLKGLEPPRREASDPKSDVATNYTTAALESCAKVMLFINLQIFALFFSETLFLLGLGQEVGDRRLDNRIFTFLDIFLGHRNLICRIDTEFRMLFVYI